MDVIIFVLSLMLPYVLFKSLLSFQKRGKKLPPGPYQLPIIGNLAKLGELPHQSLAKLAHIYGPIMHLKLGRVNTIVISSSTIAQQVLQKQDITFSSRFVPDALCACDHFKYSVAFLPVGPMWSNLRKIARSNLFSVNKLDANQHLRSSKVNELIGYVKKCSQSGQAIDIGRDAFRTSLNLLSNTIFSKDMADPNQDSAKEFKDLIWNIMVDVGKPNLGDLFPVFKKMDLQGTLVRNDDALDELIKISLRNPDELDKTQIEHLFLVC
ncbi:Geraniol 8-hydroxylase [Heracleum sosnowskyi]|uniref:Geraniol 8-hydroxylase n=1 Tax=Heracleum sosnowskyi TaxID=360622 RepID=A0AAD8IG84_9APIA|nr:Geraniol 8-hydroxylase [Heracleum sosnowskyi]